MKNLPQITQIKTEKLSAMRSMHTQYLRENINRLSSYKFR